MVMVVRKPILDLKVCDHLGALLVQGQLAGKQLLVELFQRCADRLDSCQHLLWLILHLGRLTQLVLLERRKVCDQPNRRGLGSLVHGSHWVGGGGWGHHSQ